MMCVLARFRLYSLIAFSHSPKNVFFAHFIFYFLSYISHLTYLLLDPEGWNLAHRFSINLKWAFWRFQQIHPNTYMYRHSQALFKKKHPRSLLFLLHESTIRIPSLIHENLAEKALQNDASHFSPLYLGTRYIAQRGL